MRSNQPRRRPGGRPRTCSTVGWISDSYCGCPRKMSNPRRRTPAQLRGERAAGLVVRNGLEAQLALQDLGDDGDLIGGRQRLGSADAIGLAGVPGLGERGREDRSDVRRVGHGDSDVAERRADDLASVELILPARHVRLHGARAHDVHAASEALTASSESRW